MNKPKIIITGANGYLGNYFLNYFNKLGWQIKAFTHNTPINAIKDVEYINYSLSENLNANDFKNVNYVIHSAYVRYDKNKNADKINFEGTKKLVDLCDVLAIPMIYLSSFSAHEQAVSHYGTSKIQCEKLFNLSKHAVLKIGFIIGKGGILGEMINRINTSKFFPLVGENKPLQSVYIDDLCIVLKEIIENTISGLFYVAHEKVVTMRRFYEDLAFKLDKKITFIPIPVNLLFLGCKFFETVGVQLPVSSESVLGLKKMRSFKTLKSQAKLKKKFIDYKTALDKVL